MQLPQQQDWSPELLSELQRAVPVLENSSFDLTPERHSEGEIDSQGNVLPGAGWDFPAAGGSSATGSNAASKCERDFLSEDAMALPMSTLTSGRRRTYPNRGTFQAHVCCIMDPMQVDTVLERLRESPQFHQARCWPHAYRVISPFDRQTREGSDDDGDPGAGEKMLDLLCRMGLENLLLIVSHWDTGSSNRLGAELFRCVNEQCKTLLMELQQAVRASFPPEEFLDSESIDGSRLSPRTGSHSHDDGTNAANSQSADDKNDFDLVFGDEAFAAAICNPRGLACSIGISSNQGELGSSDGQDCLAPVDFDLQDLGMLPPTRMIWATRFFGAFPQRCRPRQQARSMAKAQAVDSPRALCGQRCKLGNWGPQHGSAGGCSKRHLVDDHSHSTATYDQTVAEGIGEGLRPAVPSDFKNGPDDAAAQGGAMSRMTSTELLQLATQLRSERGSLQESLGGLARAAGTAIAVNGGESYFGTTLRVEAKLSSRVRSKQRTRSPCNSAH